MKELSIEEKAKAYDEALEKSKRLYEQGTITESLAYIFPELKESEDEGIRKAISDILLIDNDEIREILDANNVLMQDIDAWLEKQNSNVDNANKEYWRGYREGKQEILDKYADLEKQGEQNLVEFKPSFRVGDVIKPKDPVLGEPRIIKGIHPKFGYDTNNGILDFEFEDNWELVEQNPSDKVEPKFHEGEWIISDTVNKDYHICKITSIKDGNYTIESIYGYKGYNQFDVFDNAYRLWTIQDAKDGDVLAYSDNRNNVYLCIYKEYKNERVYDYCTLDKESFWEHGNWNYLASFNYAPATKEQLNTLLKAMVYAGYTFDFEKKELKKIEPKHVEWSEEDEYYRNIILYILNNECVGKTDKENAINWLKSLKSHNEC